MKKMMEKYLRIGINRFIGAAALLIMLATMLPELAAASVLDSISVELAAAPSAGSSANDDETALLFSGFEGNLDSLLNLWYVENSAGIMIDSLNRGMGNDSILPDSVYIARLDRLPTLIDMTYNRNVRSFINMYTNKKRDLVEVVLGLSNYYFPLFEEIFAFYDMPLELKYCSIIESALNPRAVSRAGATGTWQFMYGTGRMYGLTINSLVDERRDPVKSTDAAARFMRDLYKIYGDWTLVIAAYNCGPGNVNRAIRRSGGKKNFWDIYYYLPRETRGHVPAFIAATYAMNYYENHNLYPRKIDLPIPVDTVMITDQLHLGQVSEVLGIPLELLRDINPQYRYNIIPGNEKPYALKIPQEYSMQFIELQDSILAYKDSVFFDKKSISKSPSYYTSSYLPEPPSPNMGKVYYTIKSGDNLGFISEWYHVRLSDLKYWNNISGTTIRAGQKLVIYVPRGKVEEYDKINTMSFSQKQASIGKKAAESKPAAAPAAIDYMGDADDFVLYTVKSGDTLWDIAKIFPGVSDSDIIRINNLSNADNIRPGQVLKIKKKG